MIDAEFQAERDAMVETQLRRRGIADERVLDAMRTVPRHRFVPPASVAFAYDDRPLEIGSHQTISQPYMVAVMTEALVLRPEDHVLEIGTGSGYQCAVLASLVESVVSVERIPELADSARDRLDSLDFENVEVQVGDGTLGWPDRKPYDAILVTAGAPSVPKSLCDQLAVGGRLICPVGVRERQVLTRITRDEDGLHEKTSFSCVFVPLIGREGWAG